MPDAVPWHLVIAGWEQGGHLAELKQVAAELGIEETVHFVGPHFDHAKAASFIRADAFILPSFSEGLPMAVLEAWSYGLPVVITPHCNLPEGFNSNASIRVEPDIESIVKGLGVLMAMKAGERMAMGNRGFELVRKNFTWPVIAEQMCSVYQWVLDGGPPPGCMRID
jgi:poly(glycerol-phosphate) alpha-glucosyltransferase